MPLSRFLSCTVLPRASGGVSSMARSEHRGGKMTAVRASYHEELCSDGIVSPHVFDSLIDPDLGVARDRCNPPGAIVDADLDAGTHALRAKRTADGGVVSVPQARHVPPRAPRIP